MESYEEILRKALPRMPRMAVPDGYFDSLRDRIMASIDEAEAAKPVPAAQKPRFGVIRSYVATAACVAIIVAGVFTLLIEHSGADAPRQKYEASTVVSTVEQAADYMMIDNDDIYAIISE